MHTYHQLKRGLIAWLLVPLLALGGLQGQLCWCVHSLGGHADAQATHDHAGAELASDHAHDQQGDGAHGGTGCDSHKDCECIELDGTQELAPASDSSEIRRSFQGGLVAIPSTAVGIPPRVDRIERALSSERVEHNHSPPLYVLNCVYLC